MKTCVLLLAIAVCAVAQETKSEPITFRKAYIGQPISDYVDCSSPKPKNLVEGYKAHGKVCTGERGTVARVKSRGLGMGGDEGEIFWIEGRQVFKIVLLFHDAQDWEKVKYDLTQKLGEPLSSIPEVYQNSLGAKWEYGRGFWQKEDIVAFAGVKVANIGGVAINRPFSNSPDTEGIQVTITDAAHAKLPQSSKSTLD